MTYKNIPSRMSDVLLHQQNTDREETVVFPFTRYANVMNAPKIVRDVNQFLGAPFVLLEIERDTITNEELREICNGIL